MAFADKNKEKLFEALVEVKILYEKKNKALKSGAHEHPDYQLVKDELIKLNRKISLLQNTITQYGENFLDVYDAELMQPLTEKDVIYLRDEIQEVRKWLESIKTAK